MILVTGGNGVVGRPLIERLNVSQQAFISVSRSPSAQQIKWDLHSPMPASVAESVQGCDTLVHCAPIWLLSSHLESLAKVGIKRLVIFSSTSVVGKSLSSDPQEILLVNKLKKAEAAIEDFCQANDVVYTILRPSMIYGYGCDENVSHLARFIKRRGFMLLVGKAQGLRQPVHADDLVEAVFRVLRSPNTSNSIYNLAGDEVITYQAMVRKIFRGLHKPVRIIKLPLWFFRLSLRVAKLITKFNYTPEMANRMNVDLVYSNDKAHQDFGYAPQAFLLQPERDLP